MAEFDPSNLPGRGIKPLVSLLAHKRLAILVFLVVLIGGIPMVFIKGQPQFMSTATVHVAARYMKNVKEDEELSFQSNNQYRQFVEQQRSSVVRYDIVRDALAGLGEKANLWRLPGETERKSVDRLINALVVRAIPDTYIMEVTLVSRAPDGLDVIVNAVVDTYIERMRSELIFGADTRVTTLRTRFTELQNLIKDKTDRRTALALKLGLAAFTGKEPNPYDEALGDLRQSLNEARKHRYDAEARHQAFLKRGETDLSSRSPQDIVKEDAGLNSIKMNLYSRRGTLLVQLAGLTPEHPAYAELDAEIKSIDAEIESQTGRVTQLARTTLRTRLETGSDQARRLETDLEQEVQALQQQSGEYANLYSQAMSLTEELQHDREELDTLQERLNFFANERNALGFVRLVTPAMPPDVAYGPGKKNILMMVLLSALGAALVLPILIDLLDRRVHTVNDAERVLGIPALGWMVERGDPATDIFGDDLIRRMAGTLVREQSLHGTKVFAFSSVKPGAGASALVLELGRALDALGAPTLVVEANAFKPDPRMVSDRRKPGLSECLLDDAEPMACVQAGDAKTPERVWVGGAAAGRHIDRLDRMPEICAVWGEQFRFILVDIPPILLSADAEILARTLEHLVLVVEAGGITGGELRRAGRQVEKLDPAAVGIVANRVRPFTGGGYLNNLLIEYLTGRKSADYFTEPAWRMNLRMVLALLGPWRRRFGLAAMKQRLARLNPWRRPQLARRRKPAGQ